MNNSFEDVNCPVCNADDFKAKFKINYNSKKVVEVLKISPDVNIELRYCNICKHNYAAPQINEKLLDEYYRIINSEYFGIGLDEPREYESYSKPSILEIVNVYKQKGKILDIGCGYGFLLKKFMDSGWQAYGIEPSSYASKFAVESLGVNILGSYLQPEKLNKKFDVILLLDVIEHLKNPNQALSKIREIIADDGILIIGTGNIGSLNARLAKARWSYFGSYEHISFFSKNSIVHLLNKNRFIINKIIRISYQDDLLTNIIRFIKNLVVIFQIRFFNFDKIVPLALDHMIIIAKK